eukprot:6715453-Pyramimonas_sp.AAC.1
MMLFLGHLRLPAPVLYSAIEGVVAHSGLLHSVYWLRSGFALGRFMLCARPRSWLTWDTPWKMLDLASQGPVPTILGLSCSKLG